MGLSFKEMLEMTSQVYSLIPDGNSRSIYFDISKLAEECGEVAQAFNKSKYTKKDKAEELSDVIGCCIRLAEREGIDLEKAFVKKHNKRRKRFIEKWHGGIDPLLEEK